MAGRKRGGAPGEDAVDLPGAQLRASFERRFEGAAVLDACLDKAGATYTAEEVLEEFAGAAQGGATVDEVIPILFHDTPVVADAAEARRLFSNLFGAWDAVAGHAPAAAASAPVEEGAPLPGGLVQASWRATDLLTPAQFRSQWDRFSQTQQDVLTFLGGACRGLPDEAFDTAATAAFEMWRAFVAARPERVRSAALRLADLQRCADQAQTGTGEAESAPEPEPALADFASEALEIAEGEGLSEAAGLAAPLAAIRRAMSERWR